MHDSMLFALMLQIFHLTICDFIN